MEYPFCFQCNIPSVSRSVENVVVSFEFSPTLSLRRRLRDDLAKCAGMCLPIISAR
jgi:hypothetical protein